MTTTTLCAVGDVRVDHKKVGRATAEEVFDLCREVFASADVNAFNCEGIYTERTFTVPAQHTPGWAPPESFAAITSTGFDVAFLANNHAMDFGAEGLLDTIALCRSNGIEVCGAGASITEARAPAFIERNGVRFAFLAYNSVGPNEYAARPDRAGVAPMRAITHYEPIEYQPGTPCRVLTYADRIDLANLVRDVQSARAAADIVVVGFHWGLHHVQAAVSMYQQEVAYAAIDAGAEVVLGGADHVVKGFERYNSKVIYYGLGDFILDTPLSEKTHTAWRQMKHRIYGLHYDPDYYAYPFPPESRIHMIARCTFRGASLEHAGFVPCMVNASGQPEVLTAEDPRFEQVATYMRTITASQGFNAELSVDGDWVTIEDSEAGSVPLGPMYTRFLSYDEYQ